MPPSDDSSSGDGPTVGVPLLALAFGVCPWPPFEAPFRGACALTRAIKPRITGRAVVGCADGFSGLGVEALAEGSGVAVVEDAEAPAGADDTCWIRVGV